MFRIGIHRDNSSRALRMCKAPSQPPCSDVNDVGRHVRITSREDLSMKKRITSCGKAHYCRDTVRFGCEPVNSTGQKEAEN